MFQNTASEPRIFLRTFQLELLESRRRKIRFLCLRVSAKRRCQGHSWEACPGALERKFQPQLWISFVSSMHLSGLTVSCKRTCLGPESSSWWWKPCSAHLLPPRCWFRCQCDLWCHLPFRAPLAPAPESLAPEHCSQAIHWDDWIPQERKMTLYSKRGRRGGESFIFKTSGGCSSTSIWHMYTYVANLHIVPRYPRT